MPGGREVGSTAPHSLSDVDLKEIDFHITGLSRIEPNLRMLAGTLIATFSWAAHARSIIPTLVMRSEHIAVAAMFGSIRSTGVARAALHAAAKKNLPEEDVELLKRVLKFTDPVETLRNRFAHSLWASSPALPKSLILIDPAVLHAVEAAKEAHNVSMESVEETNSKDGSTVFTFRVPLDIDRDAIRNFREKSFVYGVSQLRNLNLMAVEAYEVLEAFGCAVRRGDLREKARRRMLEILTAQEAP